ncbi:MAG: DUF4062 domain-containing protein [Prevotella sp.]|nr:DUF4062 domain-containing protein [Prevotella sp.]
MAEIRIFISSVQVEFASERKRLCNYIRQDALLGRFFIPFIFEELPALNASAQEAYLTEASQCDIYLGLYGEQYGYEDHDGISPTEREYDVATQQHKHRLIYLKNVPTRHSKEERFIHKVEQDVVRKTFDTYDDLRTAVYTSLVRYLEEKEYLRLLPFDATFHRTATIDDIDPSKVELFVNLARDRRKFPIPFSAGIPKILTHMNLMAEDGRLTNSALLLFAKDPQKFFITSEVKCAQFYGTKVEKPIPFYQVFRGSLFELVDQAVGFVMGHIDARVGDRSKSTSVDVSYELPVKAVTEAIVNAIVHRDYSSNASVQVMLFRDRLEILNPGTLPFGLSLSQLSKEHSSVPTNPILANPVYLAGYIERLGTGTTDIIDQCEAMGLPTPQFQQEAFFKVIIYRKLKDAGSNNDNPVQSNNDYKLNGECIKGEGETSIIGNNYVQSNNDSNIDSNIHQVVLDINTLNYQQQVVINYCYIPRTSKEILQRLGLTRQTKNIKTYITDLVEKGFLRMIDPEHPRSKNQKYIKAIEQQEEINKNK